MSKELAKTYDPKGIEERLYTKWMDNGYFHAKVNPDKKPFTIVMPPPNVTGQLHMGHALDETMQDILIRFKRMQGYEALWQPGTRDSPVKRADMSVCSSTRHRSAHGLARQSIFVRSFMNGFRGSSRQSGTTRCPFSAMWTMCWNSTLPPIRTRSRRNTENEVPNCFKPRKPCQQSYSYLSAAICCG